MKKNELKDMLKPLIKECIKECIFEEGVLSGIITEVAHGMASNNAPAEASTSFISEGKKEEARAAIFHGGLAGSPRAKKLREMATAAEIQRQERINKLNEAASFGGVNVFEGTQEIIPESNQHGPLAGISPGNSGIDIEGILKSAGEKWKQLMPQKDEGI